ncbi:efflux RND transporter periplasmic adaptor subunit [Vibrio sp. SS-MA-C1-2]|uniref:efflux RND transporter periplasmic adaptor subunit n=1 Tax=Vibrio sp. SS-MA-C1-2 TaxID=2908646 RepID=UPI001F433B3A|nr:efflux RND transporter periplasmic adaptor subunit [Vibrio sp. SS-MA-C1-2]UJF17586.1 efflux RND transporter periplasmic adaptor subunit [Vibrio sp. SS-MA-C1-2]
MMTLRRITVAMSFLALVGCNDPEPQIGQKEIVRPAKLMMIQLGDQTLSRTFPGVVESDNQALLAFRVPGQLFKFNVKSGQPVTKGEVLAELNQDEYSLEYDYRKAEYDLKNVQFLRTEKLRKTRVVSEQDYDDALAQLKTAKANLDQAKANLQYTQLIAPYDGVISLVTTENYQYVPAKESVLHIQSNELLNIIFQLPEQLISQFNRERQVEFNVKFDTYPDYSFPATLKEVDTDSNDKTSSYSVTLIMPNPDNINVQPGMSSKVTISTSQSGNTQIPTEAILIEDGTSYVWRVSESGKVEKVKIEVDDRGYLLSGLKSRDQIVALGAKSITPEMKVKAWVKEGGL